MVRNSVYAIPMLKRIDRLAASSRRNTHALPMPASVATMAAMIPSIVAQELSRALQDFLATGFGPSNPALASVLDEFLAEGDNLVKGPYLSIALPPKLAPEGGEPFPEVPLGFTPYRHQRAAHQRLDSAAAHGGRSTIVATGTGSGKTECFLWPILNHCRRHAGEQGVKAILVYPMNALAFDQARRIAKIIHNTQALRGKLSAGLYVGEREQAPHTAMGPDHLITDRETLRERPPHILLTNYKMLDFLMIRPADARLWRHNQPGMLRYLVVDELHTFDGPQGTDLACLIRRLKDRLQVPRPLPQRPPGQAPQQGLICVGTSATVGDEGSSAELRNYAAELFGQPFDQDAILREERQSIDEVLGSAIIQRHLAPPPAGLAEQTNPAAYPNAESYLKAQHELFFGAPIEGDFRANGWRIRLAAKLREHLMFVNLLRILADGPLPLASVASRMRASLPLSADGDQAGREAIGLLNGLCALIAAAREGDGNGGLKPFLRLGLHLWVRELRRMVCRVALPNMPETADEAQAEAPAAGQEGSANAAPLLRHSDDLAAEDSPLHLPLVQCRECRVTGWGAVRRSAASRVGRDLREFYNRFFSRDMDVRFYFPMQGAEPPPGIDGELAALCGSCGHVHADPKASVCVDCGERQTVRVFCPASVNAGRARTVLSRDCPFCHASEALIILGARASSLLSVVLGQTFASKHNDDFGGGAAEPNAQGKHEAPGAQKIIAFSDNVQDAAHRAGFFSARTWQNSVRAAIAQVIAQHDGIALADLQQKVAGWWRSEQGGGFSAERFVAEFIAPDRQWRPEFRELQAQGRLADKALAKLEGLVAQRLAWETLAEFGHRSSIGRSLERTRTAALGVDQAALAQAGESATRQLREHFEPFRELPAETVKALLLGILRRMKERGAFDSPLTEAYVAQGGNPYSTLKRNPALQDFFGRRSPLPVFPATRPSQERGLEAFARQGRGFKPWYQKWVEKVLSPLNPLAATEYAPDVLDALFAALTEAGLVARLNAGNATAYGLNPARFHATTRTAVLRGAKGGRPLLVAEGEAELWRGTDCLDLATQDSYQRPQPAEPAWFGQLSAEPTWFGQLYRTAAVRRIVAAEHTALVGRDERARLQERFAAPHPKPWEPNLLSATPTLELGVDIGELSAVVLCQVPPAPENYTQRIGRAGRRDGNVLSVTVATGQPHDLYYYAEPLDMLARGVAPPGIFLNASAVLERQLTAFCLDNWVAGGVPENAVPAAMRTVYENVQAAKLNGFPYPFFDFIQRNSDQLLERFLQAFAELKESSRAYLAEFLQGDEEGRPPLVARLLNRLLEVNRERQSLRAEAQNLRRRSAALAKGPQDEASKREIEELDAERRALDAIRRRINGRDPFQFLTDEGLIPNYAFPQQGVTLRSIIYRTPRDEADEEAEPRTVYEYERPAEAALGELAPDNEFYASGRHVRIARVDTRVSPVETWRLCPACAYCENLEESGDSDMLCPRCGDPMWADEGQRRHMLPLRVVHAATADRRSRILDEKDDREPLFYTRHLVVDFEQKAIEAAYALPRPEAPFGFEYISSATFREMNFGRVDDLGRPTRFAGRETPRSGFRVCRECGTVQPRGAADDPEKAEHSRFCKFARGARASRSPAGGSSHARGAPSHSSAEGSLMREASPSRFPAEGSLPAMGALSRSSAEGSSVQGAGPSRTPAEGSFMQRTGDDAIVECLYLYRQFDSEALRLLLPVADLASEPYVASFVAALELGLRQRFGGRLPHLRAMTGDNALPGASDGRRYLILYDTVPGGTGYLKDLLAKPENLLDLLRAAFHALENCECGRGPSRDPQQDGCYRCVYAYRRSRDMEHTSRRLAMELLKKILDHADQLEEVEGLAKVDVHALLESELEARFVEALRRVAVDGDKPRVRQDLVQGRFGYLLQIGAATWFMEPQVDITRADGVLAPSRPDFLLRPMRGAASPVALFMDGFEYHRDATGEDSRKRMALARAGFKVWSLTWQDLEVAFGEPSAGEREGLAPRMKEPSAGEREGPAPRMNPLKAETLLDAQNPEMAALQRALDGRWQTAKLRRQLREPALLLLLRWLRQSGGPDAEAPSAEPWRNAIFTTLLGLFDRQRMQNPALRERFERAADPLPGQIAETLADLHEPAFGGAGAWLDASTPFADLFLALPLAAVKTPDPAQLLAVLHLRDDDASRHKANYRPAWNGALRLFNLLQFLPNAWWITREGAQAGRYPEFAPADPPPQETPPPTPPEDWQAALELAAAALHGPMQNWAANGLPAPEVGYELADDAGRVQAEAELAWPKQRVAVLHGDQAEKSALFEQAGWQAYSVGEDGEGTERIVNSVRSRILHQTVAPKPIMPSQP